MGAWNDWYHVNGNTYGTWLRGDPRGWRARHHREHVDGDYKNPPPPGTYDRLHRHSKQLLRRPPVRLTEKARQVAGEVMVRTLQFHKVELVALCVDDHHFHLLARFPKPRDCNPWALRKDGKTGIAIARHYVGIAKKESARALSKAKLVPKGGVWSVRFRCLPIQDRAHQINVVRYIEGHTRHGAAVWTILSPEPAVPASTAKR
ncbi:MAG: hypothetical protein GY778_12150 [bacterium]|nr:hypothetical protein [bacterium]